MKGGADLNLQNEVCATCRKLCPVLYACATEQRGDSAVIQATVEHQSVTLLELVRSGADLNLQNQVRYTVAVDTALHHVSFNIRRV